MPEVTVVAKRFTLVQAAHAAEFKLRNFILLEAFCLMLHSALLRRNSLFADARCMTQLQERKEGIYLSPARKGHP